MFQLISIRLLLLVIALGMFIVGCVIWFAIWAVGTIARREVYGTITVKLDNTGK
jgi:hypothetical protein